MNIDPAVLHGSWLRSTEEDTPTEIVYRPAAYKFPPSRGREGIKLSDNGALTHSGIGANDVASARAGRWLLKDRALHLLFDDAKSTRQVLQLVSASAARLVVKR
jgi:hypothetical protein